VPFRCEREVGLGCPLAGSMTRTVFIGSNHDARRHPAFRVAFVRAKQVK
jgi:hypothetical protein